MSRVNILYHIPQHLTAHQCAKLEHILRHYQGVMSAQFCPRSPHAINIEYDREYTDASVLLAYLRSVDGQTARFG